ncbi:F-box only protein 16-like [Sycon ciliatum]|uniref:F-box only protein 16-like n=1 Tax=Sycon ciliatum TaxID=27933 RepID=UPI0031F65C39
MNQPRTATNPVRAGKNPAVRQSSVQNGASRTHRRDGSFHRQGSNGSVGVSANVSAAAAVAASRGTSTGTSSSSSGVEKSAWTPLNHAATNQQLFTERMALLRNWFTNWSDGQREICLSTLIPMFNAHQVTYINAAVERQRSDRVDFTRVLPRCISIYIFSFLDPRSLCRCCSVCWYWKLLCDMDALWAPKCARFSWQLPYQPSEFEQGAWKRLYVMKVDTLRLTAAAKKAAEEEEAAAKAAARRRKEQAKSRRAASLVQPPAKPPIWRDPDPKPADLEKLSRRLHKDPKLSRTGDHSPSQAPCIPGQTAAVGQAASDTNKALMKSGPVDLAAISQPTKASTYRRYNAKDDISFYGKTLEPRRGSKAGATTTAQDRLKTFKRIEKHRQAVVEAVKKKEHASPGPVEAVMDQPEAGRSPDAGSEALVDGDETADPATE